MQTLPSDVVALVGRHVPEDDAHCVARASRALLGAVRSQWPAWSTRPVGVARSPERLAWAESEGCPFVRDAVACGAARNGRLDMLRWTDDHALLARAGAAADRPEVVRALVEAGRPIAVEVAAYLDWRGHSRLVDCAVERQLTRRVPLWAPGDRRDAIGTVHLPSGSFVAGSGVDTDPRAMHWPVCRRLHAVGNFRPHDAYTVETWAGPPHDMRRIDDLVVTDSYVESLIVVRFRGAVPDEWDVTFDAWWIQTLDRSRGVRVGRHLWTPTDVYDLSTPEGTFRPWALVLE